MGYIVWSVHALDEGLGLLPALELQYLLAGSLLALILLVGLLLGIAVMRISFASERGKHSLRRSIRAVARMTDPVLVGAVSATVWVLTDRSGHLLLWVICATAFGLPVLLSLYLIPGFASRHVRPLIAAWVGANLAFSASLFYVTVAYPDVPQELGGVKPRCGYVEIARADASPALAREVFAAGGANDGVARSRKLSIFFSGGDAYIVRVRNVMGAHVHELRKQIVKSVADC